MNYKRLLSLLVLLAIACSGRAIPPAPSLSIPQTPAFTTTAILEAAVTTATATPSPMLAPSATRTSIPTMTLTRTPSPSATAQPQIITQCIPIATKLPKGLETGGVIVFVGEPYISYSYLLEVKTGRKMTLWENEGVGLRSFEVSPERNWLAFMRPSLNPGGSRLVIMGSNGKQVQAIPWEDLWRAFNGIAGWLDEERLLISRTSGKKYDPNADSMIVLNPFTGEQSELLPDYPDMAFINLDWYGIGWWGGYSHNGTVYDPSLSRVVYYKYLGNQSWGLSLWDRQAKKELVFLPDYSFYNRPKWFRDGSRFIASIPATLDRAGQSQTNLFLVSRDGEVRQLTDLGVYSAQYEVSGYEWSPDGRKIAFQLSVQTSQPYPDIYPDSDPQSLNRLAVLDLETGLITDTCVPGVEYGQGDVVWSPDGDYVLFDSNDTKKSRVYLVSIAQGFAVQIAENVFPVGWLKKQ